LGAEAISVKLKIPVRLVLDIVRDLNAVGLVSTIHSDDKNERLCQSAMDINSLTIKTFESYYNSFLPIFLF
jgi:hypothetical protein